MSAHRSISRRLAIWLLRNEVPRKIDAVHLQDWLHNEVSGTDDPAAESALYETLDHIGAMDWTP